jgi:hypothetical protein
MIDPKAFFANDLNHQAEDPRAPIDPLTYVTPEGDTCLHLAAIRGSVEMVAWLLDQGLEIDAKGDMGYTALYYACRFDHREVYRLLLERGADTTMRNGFGQLSGAGDDDISPGDIYEDVFFHPCLCVGVEDGAAWGISLIDGSQPRTVDLGISGVRKLTVQQAWEWKQRGPEAMAKAWNEALGLDDEAPRL